LNANPIELDLVLRLLAGSAINALNRVGHEEFSGCEHGSVG
jgi:hypothetical protein